MKISVSLIVLRQNPQEDGVKRDAGKDDNGPVRPVKRGIIFCSCLRLRRGRDSVNYKVPVTIAAGRFFIVFLSTAATSSHHGGNRQRNGHKLTGRQETHNVHY